jgi:hypothetical protein
VLFAQAVRDGAVIAEPPRQKPARADLRHEAEPTECRHEHGALGGDDDIAGEYEGKPDARRGAIERCDEQLVGRCNRPDDAAELAADPTPWISWRRPRCSSLELLGCRPASSTGRLPRRRFSPVITTDRIVGLPAISSRRS